MNDPAQSASEPTAAPKVAAPVTSAPPIPTASSVPPIGLVKRAVIWLVKGFVICILLSFGLGIVMAVGNKPNNGASSSAAVSNKPDTGSPSTSSSSGSTLTRPSSTLTKEEWKAQAIKALPDMLGSISSGNISCKSSDFYRMMGKPERSQSIGENTYLYYRCSDGVLQLVCWKQNLEQIGELATTEINDY